ncbi:Similar to Luciferin 4-monooxygenase (Luciola mingrelica) [Cotesia congregata]|uniref:Similar to Luciferin 4-monooxygenase (Luciola mingrelica) n=1 Tax=Cotesia congregata TaxID=51543 RepID=A0A8J2MQA3_COTCN|nr:Similar to Luciferin 4-monooxygenase (Luciola mingrelica) [Cotesia congregata]
MALKYQDSQPIYQNGIWKGVRDDLSEGYFKFGERILNQFKQNPDFIGQIDSLTGKEDTYKSMGDRSIRCALWLINQGIRQGDIVGLCSKNQLDCCIPLFASLYLGTICSPMSHKYMDEELVRYYIDTRQPKVMFINQNNADMVVETAKKMGYSMPIIVFGQKDGLLSFADILRAQNNEEVDKFKCTDVKPQDPTIIINTSGTTNLPKGVLHSYGSYANMFKYYKNDEEPSTVIGFYGINTIAGIRTVIRSVIFKATVVVADNLSGRESLELIEKFKVTRLWMTIYTAYRLMKSPDLLNYNLSSVELVAYGGGKSDEEAIKFLQKLFYNADLYSHYGGTEFGTALTKKVDFSKVMSAGRVMANVEIKVVDSKNNKILGPNEEGEVYIRTPKLMTGYWDNPKATADAVDSEGWYHTGDLGYYDTDGDFFFVARINEFISIYTNKTLSSVIVDVIKKVPGVDEVAVVPRLHPDYYEVPMAFVTVAHGMQVTEDDINGAVEKKLPDYMKLRGGIRFLETMPRTDSGKINNMILRAIVKASLEE